MTSGYAGTPEPTGEQCPETNGSGRCHFGEGHTCGYHLFPDTPDGGPYATPDSADAAAQPHDLLRARAVSSTVSSGDLGSGLLGAGAGDMAAGSEETLLAGTPEPDRKEQ